MRVRKGIEILRRTIGSGPANLLVFLVMIADSDGFAGPITLDQIYGYRGFTVTPPTLLRWYRKLEEAGVARVEINKEGYLCQLLGTENMPFRQWVDEFLREEPAFIRARASKAIAGMERFASGLKQLLCPSEVIQ